LSERPFVCKTWALKGKTPLIKSAGAWKRMSFMGTIIAEKIPSLFLRAKQGSVNRFSVLKFLKELKKQMAGKKLLFFWDSLSAHRAKIVSQFVIENKDWLHIERFPSYAPELNPVEYLWSAFKKHGGNSEPNLGALKRYSRKARKRFSNNKLLTGFLKASGLYN